MAPISFRPEDYGEAFGQLLSSEILPPLGPGAPDRTVADQLQALTLEQLFRDAGIRDRAMASCCLAGLWLLFDYLHESHQISQRITTVSGSYWHGIMHRREPDYANAKYWFHKVGDHPIHDRLAVAAAELICEGNEFDVREVLSEDTRWDAFRFVDLCQRHAGTSSVAEVICRQLALIEWQLLFDYCYRQATRGPVAS